MDEGRESFLGMPLGLLGQYRIILHDECSFTMLFKDDLDRILEHEECAAPWSCFKWNFKAVLVRVLVRLVTFLKCCF